MNENERRANPFCNLFEVHCKPAMDEIKADIKAIKHVLMEGNGDSLMSQASLNTAHRKWMESWGRGILLGVTMAAITSIAIVVVSHASLFTK